ncbi:MAG: 4-(cytidine 5'-diphospho)-2-C-methyl-D-erythritol kinase [Candidatus Raymondbacteria bacterium RifOxyA12_full_50_37]|uniref:4-diphosphocytidyl-2-C-methyl-D-erythritol kinase n=1 Tax=Candidatus Raymondbacteria bacterium RIFOXYD12_FULL_49_13 TaxID=1817890 RepID=A0A1F7FKI5_UNCRA|nr:MAG: 4-(cytidine 5'-diphospho)-2-C-methyl-D-erythritol kinase [Candidatus Raymondbacteria bacterium RifOxyA12_full_50_37]OGJ88188.1 MAG: 4-(cytidine 5'-diphospho)-2-C-methyl-D-erythritol kinase [Candidatus Raymondbacteria bacterium RIFOXYA2_FULL_49_16]OGJ98119.1 MAG: 4-(cytidine 5'-diphospho)-2-C-methyl-D-erythritol kinase [Candidatus Raymondbacteria bacterium RifOxyB12_full_50_8]OGK01846.1 MAG: 4-(cytidine 5'-diphospho)-2-C-methyl-D-erythritol kinase [Candidatus Raymondbacteria bacterium Rif
MILKSYAKINLGLHVLNKRADGYHNIETVFAEISLHDTIRLSPCATIRVRTNNPDIPCGPDNIAYKAALLVQEAYGVKKGVSIHITKRVPHGAGLGGGSSNAAAVVKGLIDFWDLAEKPLTARSILRQLGSDVPFFNKGGFALATGRGEKLRPLPPLPSHWIVLVHPAVHIATPAAYRMLKRRLTPANKKCNLYFNYLDCAAGRTSAAVLLQNDFEGPVFRKYPRVAAIKNMFRRFNPVGALLTGSGSTVYALFSGKQDAHAAAEYFIKQKQRVTMARFTHA